MNVQFKFIVYGFLLLVYGALSSCNKKEEVFSGSGVYKTMADGNVIEGELFLPPGSGPFPVLIAVPGSGSDPRQNSQPIVDLFNPLGIAIYLYDKRGIGGSTGSYPLETPASQPEFLGARANDVLSIIKLMEDHIDIDNSKIGLLGSSQGAWVNSLVFNQSNRVSFIVMTSCGVASTGLENYYSELTDDPNVTLEEAYAQLGSFSGESGFDPLPIIQTMSIPVMWIFGAEDRSYPARYSVPILNDLKKSNFNVTLFQNTNHDLVDINTGELHARLIPDFNLWFRENIP